MSRLPAVVQRVRRVLVPPGSRRAWLARRVRRGLGILGVGRLARRMLRLVSRSGEVIPRDLLLLKRKLAELRRRIEPGRELFIFLPSIPWNVHLFQRPQHLARRLAQQGQLVIYDCSGTNEDVAGLRELEPNLFLYKGEPRWLAELPDPVLWTFPYNFHETATYPPAFRRVYDWIDDLGVFPYDQRFLRANHRRALATATLVVSVARRLHDEARHCRPDAIYLPNAVEYQRFAAEVALPEDPVLAGLVASGKPLAGYYGALAEWFDYRLLDEVARARPDWNFVLIGPSYDGSLDGQPLLRRGNVHWLGPRPYEQLPGYLRALDCALIPFLLNDITLATSPLKLYEYLAGGKPVITTAMPECMAHPEVHIVRAAGEFSTMLDVAREEGRDPLRREKLRAIAAVNSWDARVETILGRLAAL